MAEEVRIPHKVLSLDIETESVKKKGDLPRCLVCGWKTYEYNFGTKAYEAGRYYWLPEAKLNRELEGYLEKFPGLIIGHNLWGFDYPVLQRYFKVDNLVSKTVDTLEFLRDNHKGKGLDLDSLAQNNLGLQKSLDSRQIGRMWKRTWQQMEVLRYNAGDCEMTMRLWIHLLREQRVLIKGEQGPMWVEIRAETLPVLTGQKEQMTLERWRKRQQRRKTGSGIERAVVNYGR